MPDETQTMNEDAGATSAPPPPLTTPGDPRGTGICLNVIVTDQSPGIARMLRSVSRVVDYLVIVDTGTTGAAADAIVEVAEELQLAGEIHSRPWVDFGHNRQEALELAIESGRGQWLLLLDAGEEFSYADPSFVESLEPGVTYRLEKYRGTTSYWLPSLIDITQTTWQWRGALYEFLDRVAGPDRFENRTDCGILVHEDARVPVAGVSPQEQALQDAAILQNALATDPSNARNRFYLAQTYRNAGLDEEAYESYGLRTEMGGWEEEIFISLVERANLAVALKHPFEEIVAAYLSAFRARPSRIEPLYYLATFCREQERYAEGYIYAKGGLGIPMPPDSLFVLPEVYSWRLLDEFAVCAYWLGRYRDCFEVCQSILGDGFVAEADRERIEANYRAAEEQLSLSRAGMPPAEPPAEDAADS